MDIRAYSPDYKISVVEIDSGTDRAWHFMPFEDRTADLFALDERYVLAIGNRYPRDTSIAIFDRFGRTRTVFETNDCLDARTGLTQASQPRTWCFAPAHRSVFVAGSAKKSTDSDPHRSEYLYQYSVDGTLSRRLHIAPGFHVFGVVQRDDGLIICLGLDKAAVLDPISGAVQISTTDRINFNHLITHCGTLRWISPDGRWALRPHLGTVLRSAPPDSGRTQSGLLSRLLSSFHSKQPVGDDHPDLAGARGFGMALDLFRLDPIGLEKRLIVGWYPELALNPKMVRTLDGLADQQDHRTWDGQRDMLITSWRANPESDDINQQIQWWFDRIVRIDWDHDSCGFTIALKADKRDASRPGWTYPVSVDDLRVRHVGLDGTLGPAVLEPGTANPSAPLPSQTALDAIAAQVRERSSHAIRCADWTGTAVAATLANMRHMIEERGLEPLIFADQLKFRFKIDGRSIGEKRFFEQVRTLPRDEIALVLPELRALLRTYGSAARQLRDQGQWAIMSGPSDHSQAAMSEAAITLAMLDDTGFDALRDWIIMVDQEHDYVAAAKVFPAMAKRTGFATPEAVRFGIWFFLQQWQTVKYEKSYLGLFKAARDVVLPAQFAQIAMEQAQNVASFSKETSIEGGLSNLADRLGQTFWDRSVRTELERLLSQLEAEGQA